MREFASPPIISATSLAPEAMYAAPVIRAYMNPAHAASTSTAAQLILSRSCTRHAVEGNDMSGVNVARTSRSTSVARTLARSRAWTAAAWQRSLVASCGRTWRRSRMPVRRTIQSESKPNWAWSLSLSMTVSGR